MTSAVGFPSFTPLEPPPANYQSITCTDEHEQLSFEELRWNSDVYQQPKLKYQAQLANP